MFRPTHGLSSGGDKHDEFKVVGVLAPTGTANDRAMFINIEGFYLLEGHARPSQGRRQRAPVAMRRQRPRGRGRRDALTRRCPRRSAKSRRSSCAVPPIT